MAQILIIEDEVLLAKSLSRSLIKRGHDCVISNTAEDGIAMLEKMPTDIVLLDIQLPGMSGLDAIKHIRSFDANISVIISTAYATMASVVEAMRSGACDFLRKPLDIEEVALAVDRAMTDARLKQTVSYYHNIEAEKIDENRLVCNSPSMKAVEKVIAKLIVIELPASSDFPPVLILGETGTGKDLAARFIHYHGRFSEKPFIEVNCTTLPRGLEEAELFGYEKGSFTGADRSKRGLFEAAEEGTIFLNEIGDLNLEAQVKLLRVIEQKCLRRVGGLRDISIGVRIIAASNRNLKDPRLFREDLFYRLNNLTFEMPPLRNRREDIAELARLFLSGFGRKYKVSKELSEDAIEAMLEYSWPGNVRELRQLMERVTFLDSEQIVTAESLNLPLSAPVADTTADNSTHSIVSLPPSGVDLEQVERDLIIQALRSSNGNISEAAKKLSLTREALRYRVKKHAITKSIEISD